MRAILFGIGNELISGQTVDTNSAWLALRLAELDVRTVEHRTLGDDVGAIAEAFADAAGACELIIATGGLGPTADDVTRDGLARAMGVTCELHEPSLREIERFFERRGRAMIPENAVQAHFPRGSEPIENPLGTAPGIAARLGEAQIFVTPGVPSEMRRMFADRIAPQLGCRDGRIVHHLVQTFGLGESDMAAKIRDLMDRSANPLVGTTVADGLVGVRVTARGDSAEHARALVDGICGQIRERLDEWIVGEGETTLAEAVGRELDAAGHSLALAESCTGGLVGKMLTDVSGASGYFLGGIVAYDNRIKREMLGVEESALDEHGAVSGAVAEQMARGARGRFGSDWALSLTGIAGPAGGSEEKPVGLVWIGLAGPEGAKAFRHVFAGERDRVRNRAALTALDHLRRALRVRA